MLEEDRGWQFLSWGRARQGPEYGSLSGQEVGDGGKGWGAAVIWGHGFMFEEKASLSRSGTDGWFSVALLRFEGQGCVVAGSRGRTLLELPRSWWRLWNHDIWLSDWKEERHRLCPSCNPTSVWATWEGSRPAEEKQNNHKLRFSHSKKYVSWSD